MPYATTGAPKSSARVTGPSRGPAAPPRVGARRSATAELPSALPPIVLEDLVEADCHVLLWQVRGESVITTDGIEHVVSAGAALWVPAGTLHSIATNADSVLLPMFFTVEQTITALRDPTVIVLDSDLRTLCLALVQSTYSIIRPNADLARLVLSLIDDLSSGVIALPLPTTGVAATVAGILRSTPADGRSVAELANVVHASTRTIERAFRNEVGMTLRRWRIENRMEAASTLLRTTSTTVDAVAHRVGYSDTNAFRRAFKASFGMAPRVYAEQFRHPP